MGLPIRSVCNVHILQPLLIDFAYIFFLPKGQRNEFTALQYFFYSDEVDYDCNNLNCLKNLYRLKRRTKGILVLCSVHRNEFVAI